MIPQETVDAFRQHTDVTLDIYGIPCTLHIPTNFDAVQLKDIYSEPGDYEYTDYSTNVIVEWSPNVSRLKALGMFSEGEALPIIAKFPNKIPDINGTPQSVDIIKGSYFEVGMQYIPSSIVADSFEIIDILLPRKQDAIIFQLYKIAPRRVKI